MKKLTINPNNFKRNEFHLEVQKKYRTIKQEDKRFKKPKYKNSFDKDNF